LRIWRSCVYHLTPRGFGRAGEHIRECIRERAYAMCFSYGRVADMLVSRVARFIRARLLQRASLSRLLSHDHYREEVT
ncbi:MAG: hypothetical protein L0G70_08040, partial [Rubrobacter sp.]|nr:hypothetical protein [Rubrobacter sp.]